jgi:peptidyl-prolyl cis-trans isomerase SurA
MCFKSRHFFARASTIFRVIGFSLCALLLSARAAEIVDRIVAIVNDAIITLTDIKVVEAFGLTDGVDGMQEQDKQRLILDNLISQKLVIQLASEGVNVDEEEIESRLSEIIQSTNPALAERELIQFGLDWDDLKIYIRDQLLYHKILSNRFDLGVIVSIDEIERYYEQVYVPSQREKDLEPQPMIEVLDQIERSIKRDKVKGQVEEWVNNLKREANIQIKIE